MNALVIRTKKVRESKSDTLMATELKIEPNMAENKIVVEAGDGYNNSAVVANPMVRGEARL